MTQTVQAAGLEVAARVVTGFITAFIASRPAPASSTICVITQGERNREGMPQPVQSAGFSCVTISAQANPGDQGGANHFATMHRAKGVGV